MRWHVKSDSDQPIYEQIVDQAVAAVSDDELKAGVLMPSVRELAETLLVNPNTVARAYQELERLGIVVSRRGVGMEITEAAPEACKTRRLERATSALRVALEEALAAGMARTDIDAVLDHISNSPSPMRRNTDGHRGRRSSTG